MITGYFQKSSSQSSQPGRQNFDLSPPPPPKKRNEIDGFNSEVTEDRIQQMKKNQKGISGEWCEFGKVNAEHTLITNDWTYQQSENNVKHTDSYI